MFFGWACKTWSFKINTEISNHLMYCHRICQKHWQEIRQSFAWFSEYFKTGYNCGEDWKRDGDKTEVCGLLSRASHKVKSHLCTILPKQWYQSHKNSLLLSTDVSIKPLKFLKCQNEMVVIIVFQVSFIRSLFNTHLCAGCGGLGL